MTKIRTVAHTSIASRFHGRGFVIPILTTLVAFQLGVAGLRAEEQSNLADPPTKLDPADHPISTPPSFWISKTNMLGAACLVIGISVLSLLRWRRSGSWPQRASRGESTLLSERPPGSGDDPSRASIPPSTHWSPHSQSTPGTALDLQLLRHLGDDTPGGLSREIDRYLQAFDSERQLAHTVAAGGDRQHLHRTAHRLLSHASATRCEPLIDLATTLQSEAAILEPAQLNFLLQEFDREFARLRNTLERIRVSTEPA